MALKSEEVNRSSILGGVSWVNAIKFVVFDLAAAGISFLITFAIARILIPEEYGILAYGIMLGELVIGISSFGQGKSLVRNIIQSENAQQFFSASISIRGGFALVVGVSSLVWIIFTRNQIGQIYPIALSLIWAMALAVTPQAWLDSHGRMDKQAIINLLEKIGYGLIIFFTIFILDLPRTAAIIASCLFLARFSNIFFLWRETLMDYVPFSPGWASYIKSFLARSHFIWYASIGNLMITHVTQIILEHQAGLAALGFYSFSFRLILFSRLFQEKLRRLLTPGIAMITDQRESRETIIDIRKGLIKRVGFSLITSTVLGMILLAVGPFVIRKLVPSYIDAIPVLKILTVWSIAYGPAVVVNQFLIGLDLDKYFVIVSIFSGLLSIFLAWNLASGMGAIGVALALVVSHFISILIQLTLVWCKISFLETTAFGEH